MMTWYSLSANCTEATWKLAHTSDQLRTHVMGVRRDIYAQASLRMGIGIWHSTQASAAKGTASLWGYTTEIGVMGYLRLFVHVIFSHTTLSCITILCTPDLDWTAR